MLLSDEIVERLRELEQQLWRADTRYSHEFMDDVLTPGFVEVGASGNVYDRREIIEARPRSLDVKLPLPDFTARALGPAAALVTYVSVERTHTGERTARRTSVWVCEHDEWRLAFHQGTLIGSPTRASS